MKRSSKHKVVLFDPIRSINSGQVFLWKNVNGSWYGINGQEILKFTVINEATVNNKKIISTNEVEYQSFPKNELWENFFFRLDDNYECTAHPGLEKQCRTGRFFTHYGRWQTFFAGKAGYLRGDALYGCR
jgi:hypothetical protein